MSRNTITLYYYSIYLGQLTSYSPPVSLGLSGTATPMRASLVMALTSSSSAQSRVQAGLAGSTMYRQSAVLSCTTSLTCNTDIVCTL